MTHPEVIHLVAAPSCDTPGARLGRVIPAVLCAHAIEAGLTPPGRVLLIGDSQSARFALKLGLRADLRLAPPVGRPEMLARRLRTLTADAARVICWNDELGVLLNRVIPEADLISTRPALAPHRLRKRVSVRVFERSDRDAWDARNHSAELDTVLAPVLDDLLSCQHPVTRDSLGIDPDSVCIGMLADRPGDIDAREFCFLLGLLNASGYTLSGVIPVNAAHLAAARRHHRALGERFRLLVAHDPITTMLPIFDVLLHPCFDGSGSSMLIERMCENADTPVLRLRDSGREGLSRAPGIAGPIIEFLDDMRPHSPRGETLFPEPTYA